MKQFLFFLGFIACCPGASADGAKIFNAYAWNGRDTALHKISLEINGDKITRRNPEWSRAPGAVFLNAVALPGFIDLNAYPKSTCNAVLRISWILR